jgi:hypothetical protein
MVGRMSLGGPDARPPETVSVAGRLNWTIDSLRRTMEESLWHVVVLQQDQYGESREELMTALSTDPDLPLYAPDGKHPAAMGSYLAALTIYRGLTGREPPSLTNLGISAEDDALLQAAAAAAQPIWH